MRKPDCLTKKTNELRKWIPIKVSIAVLVLVLGLQKSLLIKEIAKMYRNTKKLEIITGNIREFLMP